MTQRTIDPPRSAEDRPRRRSTATALLRAVGWLLVTLGTLVLLYVVYALFFTSAAARQAQTDLEREWTAQVGTVDAAERTVEADERPAQRADPPPAATDRRGTGAEDASARQAPGAAPVVGDSRSPAADGAAVAVLEFVRPGASAAPVHEQPLYVVDGVSIADLQQGPGHYPDTAMPGEDGNVAIAGHRTTYGAPFFHLDQLRRGDEIHLTDRSGRRWVYEFSARRIVNPGDTWVLGPDPLGTGTPVLTLTTCHPRYSAAQRMVVFAELTT